MALNAVAVTFPLTVKSPAVIVTFPVKLLEEDPPPPLKIFPQVVNNHKDSLELQSVNYIQLIPLLIKEVKELKNKFKQLNI